MKIISYSDLHLEFGASFKPPPEDTADAMILCGDIVVIKNLEPLDRFLERWRKPVLYVLGNHEYYGCESMSDAEQRLVDHLSRHHPNTELLSNRGVLIDGVQFFGGTMWTDFNQMDEAAMVCAKGMMNDYRLIRYDAESLLSPQHTAELHAKFVSELEAWFSQPANGHRVVISHHAPTLNPNSQYKDSELQPAFNSLDMEALIEKYMPDLWLYGHTHECDDHMLGSTRIVSNQAGYPNRSTGFECADFDPEGLLIELA